MQKPKIMYIAHETSLNGASKSLISLVENFENNYDITVVVRGEGRAVQKLRRLKCNILVIPFYLDVEPRGDNTLINCAVWTVRKLRYRLFRSPYNYNAVRQLANYVKKNDIKIIHTNSSSVFIGAQISMKTGVPHVWHFREFLSEDFCLEPLRGWNYLYKLAEASKSKIIYVSKAVCMKYKNRIKCDYRIIYNGIENKSYRHKRLDHTTFNLLQAGAICEEKGVDLSVRAVKYLYDKGMTDIHLYLAGEGDLSFCKNEDVVSTNTHLLGYIDDLYKLRQEIIDVELVCSRSEAFGRVTIEAMQAGIPVVASDSGGTTEIVDDGISGLLFRNGDYRDLADKILSLYNNRSEVSVITSNAKTKFDENFCILRCIEQIDNIYRSIIYNGREKL